jgi:lysophospholipid acyltransferase (LPLAT)-like uncharacterized protein
MDRPEYRLGAFERAWLWVASGLLGLLTRSLRFRIEGEERLRALLAEGRRVVLLSWHGRIVLALRPLLSYPLAIMISESRDGARIAWLAEHFGYATVRGSSSRGGVRALLQMIRAVKGGAVGGLVVDGPRGPAREVKPGAILLASRSGAVLLPLYLDCRPRWVAPSWDGMQVPAPFARVDGRFGEPFAVPPDLSEAESELLRLDLEKRMAEGYRALETSGTR